MHPERPGLGFSTCLAYVGALAPYGPLAPFQGPGPSTSGPRHILGWDTEAVVPGALWPARGGDNTGHLSEQDGLRLEIQDIGKTAWEALAWSPAEESCREGEETPKPTKRGFVTVITYY